MIGTYRFAKRLNPGDRVVFAEMGAYTFCQANWFNGVRRPAIVVTSRKDGPRRVRSWDEKDFVRSVSSVSGTDIPPVIAVKSGYR